MLKTWKKTLRSSPSSPLKPKAIVNFSECNDPAVLRQQIQELQLQLQRSRRVIHSLQSRVRSVSMTSDYVSGGERPLKWKQDFLAVFPSRKYDSLVQAQARELSHLRQLMREGQGMCHILSQHIRDTVKSFEELLRGTDIDYYWGQNFREQLTQGNQLAEQLMRKLNRSKFISYLKAKMRGLDGCRASYQDCLFLGLWGQSLILNGVQMRQMYKLL
uniref:Uncharacterized protein n=1 Tax=Salvator merianae TaxID=96440 RepID=A0A8D0EDY1_SALMN